MEQLGFFCHRCSKYLPGPCLEHHGKSVPEPAPVVNSFPAVWDLVIADMQVRDQFGLSKYTIRLQPFNGRDATVDAYQEALDLAVYLRQLIYERDGK